MVKDLSNGSYSEYQSKEIEQVIFNDECFIEKNSFSTSHQSVNVYSEADKLYEIRCEELAIDIQVSKGKIQNIMKHEFAEQLINSQTSDNE